jgi:glycosyltransferase involved in cell wall biosynthesis
LYEWTQSEPRVIYAGFTNEVEKYMAAGDIYVLPSYREGFGSAVVEAEAMALPVIVTDIPGPTDAMKRDETGLVVAKANADELLTAMETLYASPELRATMGKRAAEFVQSSFEQKTLFEKIRKDRTELIEQSKSKKR